MDPHGSLWVVVEMSQRGYQRHQMWNVLLGRVRKRHGRQKDSKRCDFGFGVFVRFYRFHHLCEHWSKFNFITEFLLVNQKFWHW